jgi:endoglucanase
MPPRHSSLQIDRRQVLKQLAMTSAAVGLPGLGCGQKLVIPPPPTLGLYLNQVGYLPGASKVASIATQQNNPQISQKFSIRSLATNAVVFQGNLSSPMPDNASGDLVSPATFSSVNTPGKYRLEIASANAGGPPFVSDPFEIRPDIYASALRLTMRGYSGQRCGCEVDLGGGYTHPACHLDGAYHASSGKKGSVTHHRGWHDAGDYGRYSVNSGLTCGTLLWAWELYPRTLGKLRLDIPESGGNTPDYLAEIRWNLEWMLSMQDADGGVWHKQTSERFCSFIMPQDDHLTSYVIGTGSAPFKSTGATADLASVMAIAARCYGPYDDAFAQRCLGASQRAYAWAVSNPKVTFTNPPGVGTGGYGDLVLSDELLWAAAELFRTTGRPEYEQTFLDRVSSQGASMKIEAPSWGDVDSMGLWTYALSGRATSTATRDRIIEATKAEAQRLIQQGRTNGYGNTMELKDFGWGSNSVAGNQSLLLFVANRFQPDPAATDAALGNLHYLLGRNCLGVSWVTQVGNRPFQHPHHRPSAADGIAAPWPGLLSGGPNTHPGDPVAALLPKMPPMRMWTDNEKAYSLNEICINWNAPLVFLLAAANDLA